VLQITHRMTGAAGVPQQMELPFNLKSYPVIPYGFMLGPKSPGGGMAIAQPPSGPPPHQRRREPLAAPQILVPAEEVAASARRRLPPAPDYGWYLLGWLGLVFVIIGCTDLAMAWYPVLIGNPQWEFGTVSRTYDNLPLTSLGLGLLLGAGVARGVKWWTRIAAVLFLVLALLVIGGLVLYATNIPLALRSVSDPLALSGLKRAIVKALVQGIMYGLVFSVLGISALRHSRVTRDR
jgi:hypothetical protein